ncbi:MAG: SMC-Scp complex subunit ScpB [Cardiobacteriaceae bacterium]|nr:SMC-Scp complex subunit ScpB [Cardiobacteriaceae bacterium]
MSDNPLIRRIEAILFTRDTAISLENLAKALGVSVDEVAVSMLELKQDYESRAMEVKQVASGWRLQLREEYHQDIIALTDAQPTRYSRAFWETLAFIAYHQPVTRAQIDQVRGVSTSSGVYKQLFDLDWIEVIGQKETVGRPDLLATTKRFLDDFSLKSPLDLPPLSNPQLTAPEPSSDNLFAPPEPETPSS